MDRRLRKIEMLTKTMRSTLLLLLLAGAGVAAQDAVPQIAIEGLDPVLLVEGREAQGLNGLSLVHDGLEYLFTSAETRARFAVEPERFAVQLDGACARMGAPTLGNPDLYTVQDGHIYLFGSEDCRRLFQATPARYLEPEQPPLRHDSAAEARARALLDKAAAWVGGDERLGRLTGYELRSRLVETRPTREIQITRHTTAVFPASLREEAAAPWGEFTSVLAPADAFRLTPRGAAPLHSLQRRELEAVERRRPWVLLRSRHEPGLVAVHAGSGSADDATVEEIDLELAGQRMRLGVEPASGRVLSLAYRGRHPEGAVGNVVELFSDYREVGGLKLPYRTTAAVDGTPLHVQSLEAVTLDPAPDAALFTRPGTR